MTSASQHNAMKTHCLNGHPFDEANTIRKRVNNRMRRVCRTCEAQSQVDYYQYKRKAIRRARSCKFALVDLLDIRLVMILIDAAYGKRWAR